jgi:hypothetical protein
VRACQIGEGQRLDAQDALGIARDVRMAGQ